MTIRKTKTPTNRQLQELPADGGSCYRRVPATPITTSRIVAEKFDKRHDAVLRDIKVLIEQSEGLHKSVESSMFNATTYTNKQNKQQPMYTMTRDGF